MSGPGVRYVVEGSDHYMVSSSGQRIKLNPPPQGYASWPDFGRSRQVQRSNGAAPAQDENPAVELLAAQLRKRLLTSADLDEMPTPSQVLEGLLVANTLAELWGKPGAAKSFVALDWALSIATGTRWLGRAVTPGPVIYVVAEGAAGTKDRKQSWQKARSLDDLGPMRWLPEAVNLLDPLRVEAMAMLAAEIRPVLIVVDTLARSIPGGDENGSDMGRAVEAADTWRRASGATVLIVHHSTKEGSTDRGHSSLEGAVDTAIECKADGQTVVLRCRKQKDLAQFEPVRLWLEEVGDSCVIYSHEGRGSAGDLTTTAAALLGTMRECCGSEGMSAVALCRVSEQAETTFYRSLKCLREAGVVVNVGTDKQPRWAPRSEVTDG